jgi:GGDEF domain-containing protein
MRPLQVVLENKYQARLLFDYLEVETKTFCLRSKNFYERLNNEISRARRLNRPISAVTFELRAKDPGHLQAGQQLVAKILKRFTRVTDFVGRISDRRFAAALPHADLENAAKKASTLLGIIQAAIDEKEGLGVTVSAGVNEFPTNVSDSMSLLEGCEEAAEQAAAFEVMVYAKDDTHTVHSIEILDR